MIQEVVDEHGGEAPLWELRHCRSLGAKDRQTVMMGRAENRGALWDILPSVCDPEAENRAKNPERYGVGRELRGQDEQRGAPIEPKHSERR